MGLKNTTMTVACDAEMVERVDRLCQAMNLSRSKVLEKIIRNGVTDLEHASKIIGMPGINALFRFGLAFENEEDAEELARIFKALKDHRRRQKEPPLPFEGLERA